MGVKSVLEPANMAVAVSTVILALRPRPAGDIAADGGHSDLGLWLPLVKRNREPYLDQWALPGGWVGQSESLTDAAGRTLAETTGLRPSYLEQLYTFGAPDRSPDDERVVSVTYTALIRGHEADEAEESENVQWFCADHLPDLAFDHNTVVDYALWRLRNKIEYAQVAFFFLDDTFSMSQLREVYEAILRKKLDPANFRRRVEAAGTIVPTAERLTGGRHRPPRLYRCELTVDPRSVGPAA
jgi:8-oxo-dGTP diphosphatase